MTARVLGRVIDCTVRRRNPKLDPPRAERSAVTRKKKLRTWGPLERGIGPRRMRPRNAEPERSVAQRAQRRSVGFSSQSTPAAALAGRGPTNQANRPG